MFWIFEQTGNLIWQVVINLITMVTESLYSGFSLNIDQNYFHALSSTEGVIEVSNVLSMVGTAFGQFIIFFRAASLVIIVLIVVYNIYIIMIRDTKKVQNPIELFAFFFIAAFLSLSMQFFLNTALDLGDKVLTKMDSVVLKGESNEDKINESVFGDLKLEGLNKGEKNSEDKNTEDKYVPNIKEQGHMTDSQLKELGVLDSNRFLGEEFFMLIIRLFIFIPILIELIKLGAEAVERWLVLFLIYTTASLPCIALVSSGTRQIFSSWCRMVFSQILLIIFNVFFMKLALFILKYPAFGEDINSVIMFGFVAYGILRLGQNIDIYLMTLGLNSAQTGALFGSSIGYSLSNMGERLTSKGLGAIGKGAGSAMGAIGSKLIGEGPGQATGLTPEYGGTVNKKNANMFPDGSINTNTAKAMAQAQPDTKNTGFKLEGANAFNAIKKSGLPGVEQLDSKNIDYNNTSFRNGIAKVGYKDGSSQIIQGVGKNIENSPSNIIKENKEGRAYSVSASGIDKQPLTEAQKNAYGYNTLANSLRSQFNQIGEHRDKEGNLQNIGEQKGVLDLDDNTGHYSLHNPNTNKTDYYVSPALGNYEGGSTVEINGEEFNTVSISENADSFNYPRLQSQEPSERINNFNTSNYAITGIKSLRDDKMEDVVYKNDVGIGYYDIKTQSGREYQSYPSSRYKHIGETHVEGNYTNKDGEVFFVVDKKGNNRIEPKEAPKPNFNKRL